MPDTTPAAWSDDDPLMEAIASAVYEQCGQTPEQALTMDDPRTIAAVAATVARQLLGTTSDDTAAAPPAPADRAAVLREAKAKAREIVAKLWGDGTTQTQLDRAGGARAVEWEIGLMASGINESAPDFFQSGHSYTHRDGSTFRCVAVTTHPDGGERVAIGWHTDTAGWTFVGVLNTNHWNHEYDGVQPPADGLGRVAEAAAGVQSHTTSEAGLSYRLEHRHRDESTWRPNTPGIGANWSWESREKADQRLAEARDRWPDFEHRLIETKTKTAVRVLPDCLACGHHKCDSNGPCGALLNSWERCTCTGTPAVPAAPEETTR